MIQEIAGLGAYAVRAPQDHASPAEQLRGESWAAWREALRRRDAARSIVAAAGRKGKAGQGRRRRP